MSKGSVNEYITCSKAPPCPGNQEKMARIKSRKRAMVQNTEIKDDAIAKNVPIIKT
jgi:hypothetical protein